MLTSFQSPPQDIQLMQWLDFVKNGCTYTDRVIQYRKNQNKALKKTMPSVIVGGQCVGGHRLENIVSFSGWVSIDIDDDHNPSINDWEHLRDQLANIQHVAFSALSLSGRGVWALIKISDPSVQGAHYRALQLDFKRIGIVLDPSKGQNANDKRFYSYDPNAVIKESAKTYTKMKGEPIKERTPISHRQYISNSNDVFTRGMNFVYDRGFTFTRAKDMHYSIFRLCDFLNFKGVPQNEAESFINKEIISLDEIQSNCISDAYKRYRNNYGAGADNLTHKQ
ncbi:MAG: hypothetical protein JJU41_13680 [Bacteroidetes bacterium]|nr:hypothetical protein [Bacteroidota bacterium]